MYIHIYIYTHTVTYVYIYIYLYTGFGDGGKTAAILWAPNQSYCGCAGAAPPEFELRQLASKWPNSFAVYCTKH